MADILWRFGISVKKENLEKFKNDINEGIEKFGIKDIKPTIKIDMEIALKDISLDMARDLTKLEPFGEANEMPVFLIKNLRIESIRAITDGVHLKLRLKDKNSEIDAIGFHLGEYVDDYRLGDKVDVVRKPYYKRI